MLRESHANERTFLEFIEFTNNQAENGPEDRSEISVTLSENLKSISKNLQKNSISFAVEAVIGFRKFEKSGQRGSAGAWVSSNLGFNDTLKRTVNIIVRNPQDVIQRLHELVYLEESRKFESQNRMDKNSVLGILRSEFPANLGHGGSRKRNNDEDVEEYSESEEESPEPGMEN